MHFVNASGISWSFLMQQELVANLITFTNAYVFFHPRLHSRRKHRGLGVEMRYVQSGEPISATVFIRSSVYGTIYIEKSDPLVTIIPVLPPTIDRFIVLPHSAVYDTIGMFPYLLIIPGHFS